MANECCLKEPDETVELLTLGPTGSLLLNHDQHQISGWLYRGTFKSPWRKARRKWGGGTGDDNNIETKTAGATNAQH